jgi:hypothetical protein
MNKLLIGPLLLALLAIFALAACETEQVDDRGGRPLRIKLTDDPGDYQQVNIDLLQVRAKFRGTDWIDLDTEAGIYDLLVLQDSVDTTIVRDTIPYGELQEVRLVLGPNNTIMVDSVLYPLQTPSAQSSGLKIKLQQAQVLIPDSLNSLTLDFDAAESIVEQGNGGYLLRPVIRPL